MKTDWLNPETWNDTTPIATLTVELGWREGEVCNRDGCIGVLDCNPVENCSCFISAPCNQCCSNREFCPDCGWDAKYDDDAVQP